MKWRWCIVLFVCINSQAYGFSWKDFWETPDQQAQDLMEQNKFSQAQDTFQRKDWRATAAYRAGDYQQAVKMYQSINKDAEAYYNQGNALAKLGQYKTAIKSYDNALALNPKHQDALYNRQLVKALEEEKQDKQNQDKQNQDKQNQDKQNQDKQNQDKQDQDKQNQDKQDQDKQDQDKQDQDKQDQDKQDQDKQDQDKQDQDKQDQDKQDQDKQDQDKQDQDKQDQDKQDQANIQKKQDAPFNREKQQNKTKWLQLVPDNPGGLLREKFLRDYLRRQGRLE